MKRSVFDYRLLPLLAAALVPAGGCDLARSDNVPPAAFSNVQTVYHRPDSIQARLANVSPSRLHGRLDCYDNGIDHLTAFGWTPSYVVRDAFTGCRGFQFFSVEPGESLEIRVGSVTLEMLGKDYPGVYRLRRIVESESGEGGRWRITSQPFTIE